MQILTADGRYAPVRERATGWPMAGLNNPTLNQNGRTTIRMATRPGGPPDLATYYRIYRNNPWVFACANTITLGLSRLQLNVYQYDTDGSGDFERVYGTLPGNIGRPSAGQALDQLMQMPEPGVGRHEWLRKIWLDKLIYGNALCVIDRGTSGTMPAALWHVSWRRVVIHQGRMTPVRAYEVQADGGSVWYDPSEVVHFGRGNNIDNPMGHSPIEALRYTAALHDAIQRHLVAYFENAARPSGVLKIQPGSSKESVALMQEQVQQLYASPEQAGRIMVTSADFQSMTQDPQSSSIIGLAELAREEICAVFRVPPPVVGILTRAIKSNVVELRSQFFRDVVGPEADAFESDVMAQLIYQTPVFKQAGLFIAFDLDSPLRPDMDARATMYVNMRGVLTPNEMRKIELRKPLKGLAGAYADTVSLPSGQVFLGLPQPQANGPEQPGALGPDGQPVPGAPVAPAAPLADPNKESDSDGSDDEGYSITPVV